MLFSIDVGQTERKGELVHKGDEDKRKKTPKQNRDGSGITCQPGADTCVCCCSCVQAGEEGEGQRPSEEERAENNQDKQQRQESLGLQSLPTASDDLSDSIYTGTSQPSHM